MESLAGSIFGHNHKVKDRIRRQIGDAPLEFVHRQAAQIDDLETAIIILELPPGASLVPLFYRLRRSRHDEGTADIGLQTANNIQGSSPIRFINDAAEIFGGGGIVKRIFVHREDGRCVRKDFSAVASQEIPQVASRDDQVEIRSFVFFLEEI